MRIRRKKGARRSGAAAVEMAIMLPVFCTLVFAQLETARLGMATQMLTIAARQGARTAVVPGKTQADVQAAVDKVLSGTGISAGTASPSPSTWQTDPGGTQITVALSVPYSQVTWFSTPMYFGSTILKGTATMSSERY